LKCDKKIEWSSRAKIISNPQNMTAMLSFFSVEIFDHLNQNTSKNNAQLPKQRINCCSKTIFLYPFTECEEHLLKTLKGKLFARYEVIPEYLVKQCMQQ
jgi:hypothetical protein